MRPHSKEGERQAHEPRDDTNNPANNHGLTTSSSHFANGVPAPNNSAAVSAAITPGWLTPFFKLISCAFGS